VAPLSIEILCSAQHRSSPHLLPPFSLQPSIDPSIAFSIAIIAVISTTSTVITTITTTPYKRRFVYHHCGFLHNPIPYTDLGVDADINTDINVDTDIQGIFYLPCIHFPDTTSSFVNRYPSRIFSISSLEESQRLGKLTSRFIPAASPCFDLAGGPSSQTVFHHQRHHQHQHPRTSSFSLNPRHEVCSQFVKSSTSASSVRIRRAV
ncbi:hypothetical protein GGS21DRAFT_282682, partial [Xylaria nigripes]